MPGMVNGAQPKKRVKGVDPSRLSDDVRKRFEGTNKNNKHDVSVIPIAELVVAAGVTVQEALVSKRVAYYDPTSAVINLQEATIMVADGDGLIEGKRVIQLGRVKRYVPGRKGTIAPLVKTADGSYRIDYKNSLVLIDINTFYALARCNARQRMLI